MDTCVICGKLAEGIIIEIDDENLEPLEKHVCNSCSEVIGEIAYQAAIHQLRFIFDDIDLIKKSMADLERKYFEGSKVQGSVLIVDGADPDSEDLSSEDEESHDEEFEDDPFSKDVKEISGPSTDVLADQLLSFARKMNFSEAVGGLLNHNVVELFWKSKGARNTYTVSPENSIKMKQVEKMAWDKIVAGIFSASNEELARELADFAKKKEGKENGQGVYAQASTHTFWRNKGLDYRSESVEIEIRKGQIERLAQEIIDKDFHEWRDKRLQMETEALPQLTKACVEWALASGRNSVTVKDVKYFRQEKKIELLEATERALYLSTNNELKARRRTS